VIGVLFVCVENSARSQMAEGFLRKYAPHLNVQSAGTRPGVGISPSAVEAMREVGIDITGQYPKPLSDLSYGDSMVVNMGCMDGDSCPGLFVDSVTDWQIEDPHGRGIEEVRRIRDQIREKVILLQQELDA